MSFHAKTRRPTCLVVISLSLLASVQGCSGCNKPPARDTGLSNLTSTSPNSANSARGTDGNNEANGTSAGGSVAGAGEGTASGNQRSNGTSSEGGAPSQNSADGAGQSTENQPNNQGETNADETSGTGPSEDSSSIPGSGASGKQSGISDTPSDTAGTLPGRPVNPPEHDAKTSARIAKERLTTAMASEASGDLSNAYGLALEAYETVLPHTDADTRCRSIANDAKEVLRRVAVTQSQQTPPQDTPTRFK